MQPDPVSGDLGQFADRIDGSECEIARRTNDHDRVVGDRLTHRLGIDGQRFGIDRYGDRPDVQIMRALVECRVCRNRQDHFGSGHFGPVRARPVTRRLDCQHTAFGAAAREVADDFVVAVQMLCAHLDDFGLQPQQTPKHARIECVVPHVQPEGFFDRVADIVFGVKDISEDAAFGPVGIAGAD